MYTPIEAILLVLSYLARAEEIVESNITVSNSTMTNGLDNGVIAQMMWCVSAYYNDQGNLTLAKMFCRHARKLFDMRWGLEEEDGESDSGIGDDETEDEAVSNEEQ